jgi:hypothetical protein
MLRRLAVFIPIRSALTHDITVPARGKTTTPPMRLYLPLAGNHFYADTSPLQVSTIADSITAGEYLTAFVQAEDLDPTARWSNPTGQGIRNKTVLARIGGKGWTVMGSLNGGEVSAKLNREMALLVGSDEPYA